MVFLFCFNLILCLKSNIGKYFSITYCILVLLFNLNNYYNIKYYTSICYSVLAKKTQFERFTRHATICLQRNITSLFTYMKLLVLSLKVYY